MNSRPRLSEGFGSIRDVEDRERRRAMKISVHRLAGAGIGAALPLMLSVDVEAAPMNTSRAPAELSAFDGSVVKDATLRLDVHAKKRILIRSSSQAL